MIDTRVVVHEDAFMHKDAVVVVGPRCLPHAHVHTGTTGTSNIPSLVYEYSYVSLCCEIIGLLTPLLIIAVSRTGDICRHETIMAGIPIVVQMTVQSTICKIVLSYSNS